MFIISLVLFFFFSFDFILSHVQFSNPQDLATQFKGHIRASYSNFGKIAYGYYTIGKLYYDLSDKEKDYACSPLTGITFLPEANLDRYPIIMVDRGENCTFVTKTRNVQNAGGHLALIVNNEPGEDVKNIIMWDDGTGSDINIPAVLISFEDGQKIKNFLLKNKNDQNILSSIVLSVEFEMIKTDIVRFQIFFSSTNKKIYRILKEFYEYYSLLKNYLYFVPHYISHESILYKGVQELNVDNCIGGGKYCVSPRYDLGITNGREILFEDIRQKCIYMMYLSNKGDQYFKYMFRFYEKCIMNLKFNVECSKEVYDEIGLSDELMQTCLQMSFQTKEYNELKFNNENNLLELDYKVRKQWNIKVFPTLMVNNKTIYGAQTAENLVEAICAGFIKKPDACYYFSPQIDNITKNDDLSFWSILLIVSLVIALNIIIIYLCKKYIIKRIHERVDNLDINGRINNVVTSYLALRETK